MTTNREPSKHDRCFYTVMIESLDHVFEVPCNGQRNHEGFNHPFTEAALATPAVLVCDVAKEPCEMRRDWDGRCWHMRETSATNAEKLEFTWGKFQSVGGSDDLP